MGRHFNKIGLVALTSFAVLSACGNDEKGNGNTGQEQQILQLAAESEMDTMDTTISTTNFTPMNNVYEGLVTYDLEGNLVPGNAANMPEVSEDGVTYTFTLRDDANWSNGTPVTADDFVFAWKRMVNPENGSGYAYLFSGIVKNAEAILNGEAEVDTLGVESLDDKTLKVTLEKPVPYFLDVLTIPCYFPQNEA
ncbi:MAG: ABC transporter substrate-binding protein, partial [Carnobacterium jeotgali]|uniref:ABC transporter substrate-binding protein n=1 Tax=Carnobacterium jeotgali TaxID=545534 RepID=UPI003C7763C5